MRLLVISHVLAACLWGQSFAARVDDDSQLEAQAVAKPEQPTHALLPRRDQPDSSPCSVSTAPTPYKSPLEDQVKAAEEQQACVLKMEEAAEKDRAIAIEVERKAEQARMDAHKNAMKARSLEKDAADSRDKASRDAIDAAQNLELQQDIQRKTVIAKDKLAQGTLLSKHAMQLKAQAEKEMSERQQALVKAEELRRQAAVSTRMATNAKAQLDSVSAQNSTAHSRAREAVKEAFDSQAIVDRMYHQRDLSATMKAEIAATRAKEMQAKSQVAKNAAKLAADHVKSIVG